MSSLQHLGNSHNQGHQHLLLFFMVIHRDRHVPQLRCVGVSARRTCGGRAGGGPDPSGSPEWPASRNGLLSRGSQRRPAGPSRHPYLPGRFLPSWQKGRLMRPLARAIAVAATGRSCGIRSAPFRALHVSRCVGATVHGKHRSSLHVSAPYASVTGQGN